MNCPVHFPARTAGSRSPEVPASGRGPSGTQSCGRHAARLEGVVSFPGLSFPTLPGQPSAAGTSSDFGSPLGLTALRKSKRASAQPLLAARGGVDGGREGWLSAPPPSASSTGLACRRPSCLHHKDTFAVCRCRLGGICHRLCSQGASSMLLLVAALHSLLSPVGAAFLLGEGSLTGGRDCGILSLTGH